MRTPLAAAAAAALCSLALLAPGRVGAAPPWGDPSAPPQDRARLLLRAMTLDDKIALLHGAGLLQGSLAAPPGTKPDGSFYVGYIPPNPRLGIPAIKLEDGPAGVGDYMPGVTAFPAPVAAAATWDSALMRRYGAAIGAEELGKGVDVTLAPTVNIVRVPQWGRAFESLGEDPYLAARMAVADIEGIQSTGEIADVKHFAAYNQEVNRMAGGNAVVDDRTLHEIYMPAFAAAITEAGVGSVMCSYNEVNGVQACNNRDLLTTALKREMGLPGFVISDWYGTHDTVQSANAGLDMEMPGGTFFGAALKKAVLAGSVSTATVDDKVVRILLEMFRFSLFDHPKSGEADAVVTSPEHLALARDVAAAGTVLLKNAPGTLPMAAGQTVAVIGQDAVAPKVMGCGSAMVEPSNVVSPLQGITARDGQGIVSYASGADLGAAVAAARAARVAVVFAADDGCEGRDRPSMELPDNQADYRPCDIASCDTTPQASLHSMNRLIEAVAAANPHTVVVLNTGAPVLMPWASKVAAILEGWYAGQEDGNAVAAVLYGDVDPAGRLPVTFPVRPEDVAAGSPQQYPGVARQEQYSEGVFVGYRHVDDAGLAPLFPFGHGLSYTSFAYSDLQISGPSASSGDVVVSFTIRNSGSRRGAEVPQVYVGRLAAPAVPQPPRQLKGFTKVVLDPGRSARIDIPLDPRAFSYYDSAAGAWASQPGGYPVMVGSSSRDIRLAGTVTLGTAVAAPSAAAGAVRAASTGPEAALVATPGTAAPASAGAADEMAVAAVLAGVTAGARRRRASNVTPQRWRTALSERARRERLPPTEVKPGRVLRAGKGREQGAGTWKRFSFRRID